jgi:HNH endonuclease
MILRHAEGIVNARSPSSLDSTTLSRRLRDLAAGERNATVDFLLHLDEFDRRRAYLEAGYSSLWDYCLKVLHLREGAAGRRIGAMRVLRQFPSVEGALRDGRLCPSTLALLGQVLTAENVEELVARAAYRTKAEVDELVATIRPRAVPRDGLRRLPQPAGPANVPATAPIDAKQPRPPPLQHHHGEPSPRTATPLLALTPPAVASTPLAPTPSAVASTPLAPTPSAVASTPLASSASVVEPVFAPCAARDLARRPATEIRAVSEDEWSLRVTIDRACKEELERLTALLSHKLPRRDLTAVLREAIRCGLEKHGKRRGAVTPARSRRSATAPSPDESAPHDATNTASDGGVVADRRDASEDLRRRTAARAIPAAVRRLVWERDGGRCTWTSEDGRRCDSRWQLEVDHVVPVARGGTAEVRNLRLTCRRHNVLHAEHVYGREHMARFRRGDTRAGEFAVASDGDGLV